MAFFPATKNQIKFSDMEEKVLAYWQAEGIFEKSVSNRDGADRRDFVFYDGPPFATGLPHYGHILTGYIKDTVPRYFTMKGCYVPRRFGWDCHGLPVEYEVEKELDLHSKLDIEAYGVGGFNEKCRDIVLRYTGEWEKIMTRFGRWVDFNNDYKTMDKNFTESVINVFKTLYDRDLIYEGSKVVAYCYRCQTPISNFETRIDDAYRPVPENTITVRFQLEAMPEQYVLAWTTTPWTLPSNVALAVAPDLDYARYEAADGTSVWLAASCAERYADELNGYVKKETRKGRELAGLKYQPLLPYFPDMKNAFQVIEAEYVSDSDGTGVVHIAPSFGEDDLKACIAYGIEGPNPVDESGNFMKSVTDFAGMNVHKANPEIIGFLQKMGRVFKVERIEHDYPHCWRCDTPLIYKSIPSWFVRVTAFKDKLLASNEQINWYPEHIKYGQFGKWLANARDWAISRNRYWGSPIPVWKCDNHDCKEVRVYGSVAEIEAASGQTVDDFHRPKIDEITIPCPSCGGTLRRIPDVLDCWFESGSMPYAQVHYPFENREWFDANFPADFIVEYIAQTRGWFYTLIVLSSALFEKPPFTNVICHGVMLAPDGRKMSKRLKNYPDPMYIVDTYGSDSLRISLMSSPIVRGLDLAFSEDLVVETTRRYLIPLWNAFHFLASYANLENYAPKDAAPQPDTLLDRYILAELQLFKKDIDTMMAEYDLIGIYERAALFIDTMNNWYIRLNRRRFWGKKFAANSSSAFDVLYHVLKEFVTAFAPFAPFICEEIYRGLTGGASSVHLQDFPAVDEKFLDEELIKEMEAVKAILSSARHLRERNALRVRQPLKSMSLFGYSADIIAHHRDWLLAELNVKEVACIDALSSVMDVRVKLNGRSLGAKLKAQTASTFKAVEDGAYELLENGHLKVGEIDIEPEDFEVSYVQKEGFVVEYKDDTAIALDIVLDDALVIEGLSRDVNRWIQSLRKDLDLNYDDQIDIRYEATGQVKAAIEQYCEWIASECLAKSLVEGIPPDAQPQLAKDSKEGDFSVYLFKA